MGNNSLIVRDILSRWYLMLKISELLALSSKNRSINLLEAYCGFLCFISPAGEAWQLERLECQTWKIEPSFPAIKIPLRI